MKTAIEYEDVYYAEIKDRLHSDEEDMDPIAIRPYIKNKNEIEWGITSPSRWGKALRAKNIEVIPSIAVNQCPESIIVKSIEGNTIVLSRLTLDLYNQKVKWQLSGTPEFTTDDEMKKYFLETNFQEY